MSIHIDFRILLSNDDIPTVTLQWTGIPNRIRRIRLECVVHRCHSSANLVHLRVFIEFEEDVGTACTSRCIQTKRKMGTSKRSESHRMAEIPGGSQKENSRGSRECQSLAAATKNLRCIWSVLIDRNQITKSIFILFVELFSFVWAGCLYAFRHIFITLIKSSGLPPTETMIFA